MRRVAGPVVYFSESGHKLGDRLLRTVGESQCLMGANLWNGHCFVVSVELIEKKLNSRCHELTPCLRFTQIRTGHH
jgi:hypothetical protein